MGDKCEYKILVQIYKFIGIFRVGEFVQKLVNFYEVNSNVGDALVFNISNIK